MARDTWFETVAIAQERAKKRLPKSAYSSLISASEKGVTVSDNVQAFSELGFAPHVVGATEKREMATTVMGQDISMPVIISPADYDKWLDASEEETGKLQELLRPYEGDELVISRVESLGPPGIPI